MTFHGMGKQSILCHQILVPGKVREIDDAPIATEKPKRILLSTVDIMCLDTVTFTS